jgi:phytoene dehydrogenase-like protein
MTSTNFDTIIIGSGAGGLTAAVALSNAGQKVLVCEQHGKPGGWTHSFKLEGHLFSPGVHYIGGLNPGEYLDRIFRGLGVSKDLQFFELNPNGFDHMFIGDKRFDIPKGKEKYIERLVEHFSNESEGIHKLFKTIDDIGALMGSVARGKIPLTKLGKSKWLWKSGGALIKKHVKDPVLRAILLGQAGDYGLPPSAVSAFMHTGIMRHYFNGGFYPKGGAIAIPLAFVNALKKRGNEIKLKTPINKIIIESGRTIGVETVEGDTFYAENVVSNADPETTFIRLIGKERLSKKLNKKLNNTKYSTSCVSLFLGVEQDLKEIGLDSGNYWFYEHADIDKIYSLGKTDYIINHKPPGIFMTITSLKDPTKTKKGFHTVEAFSFTGYDAFIEWENEPKGERSEAYNTLKDKIMDNMLSVLEGYVPGLRGSIVFRNLSTPLTIKHYINSHKGNIYGTDKINRQIGPWGYTSKTEIKNLYLCGASTFSHGVAGVIGTGLQAAAAILNCNRDELLDQNGPPLKISPSDNA